VYLYLEKSQQFMVALPEKFRRTRKIPAVAADLGIENSGSQKVH
jgi:hypothetical protein